MAAKEDESQAWDRYLQAALPIAFEKSKIQLDPRGQTDEFVLGRAVALADLMLEQRKRRFK